MLSWTASLKLLPIPAGSCLRLHLIGGPVGLEECENGCYIVFRKSSLKRRHCPTRVNELTEDDSCKLTVGVMPGVTIRAMSRCAAYTVLSCGGIAVADLARCGIDVPAPFHLGTIRLRTTGASYNQQRGKHRQHSRLYHSIKAHS